MTVANFAVSLPLTLVYEGDEVDDPRDPGGRTKCGVTQRTYDENREARHLPRQSVYLSTRAEREAIYRQRYWRPCGGDDLPLGVDYATFDFGVNSGVRRAVRYLQAIVGAVQDGAFGSHTLANVRHYTDQYGPTALADALCNQRLHYLQTLPTWPVFGHGWQRRVMGATEGAQVLDTGVIDRAFVMAGGGMATAPAVAVVTPKTYRMAA